MIDWNEVLSNMSDEERMEFYSETFEHLDSMSEEEQERFLKLIDKLADSVKALTVWDMIENELASRKDEDYEASPTQYTRFVALSAFFFKLAKDNGGELESIPLEPKKGVGYISATVKGLKLEGDTREAFFSAIRMFSSFGITALTAGGLVIEGVVPKVFIKKGDT